MQGPPLGLGGAGVRAQGPKGMMFTIGMQSFTVAQSCFIERTVWLVTTCRGWGMGQAVQTIMFWLSTVCRGIEHSVPVSCARGSTTSIPSDDEDLKVDRPG